MMQDLKVFLFKSFFLAHWSWIKKNINILPKKWTFRTKNHTTNTHTPGVSINKEKPFSNEKQTRVRALGSFTAGKTSQPQARFAFVFTARCADTIYRTRVAAATHVLLIIFRCICRAGHPIIGSAFLLISLYLFLSYSFHVNGCNFEAAFAFEIFPLHIADSRFCS